MGYALLPVPPDYAGPSGELGQILLNGIATRISVFHGESDDEADWHVHIRPDPEHWPMEMYCEIMVLDDFSTPFIGDDQFFSADFTLPFRLSRSGSAHPAWDLGREAIRVQGSTLDCSEFSRLVRDGGRVYLQGAFVNDEAHDTRVEIHPLDSMAFAMDAGGRSLSARPGEAGWPTDAVRWRVAAFANSALHRINRESFVARPRRTTWYLAPPALPAPDPLHPVVNVMQLDVVEEPRRLWEGNLQKLYDSRGLDAFPPAQFAEDPRDGHWKLKVEIRMKKPGNHGGIVVRDFLVRRVPPLPVPG